MKLGMLIIGVALILATYFLLPSLNLPVYATYAGYGLGGLLALVGLLGKKKMY